MSWIRDQHLAAARDLGPLKAEIARLGALHNSATVSDMERFSRALVAAMKRRVVIECPHTDSVAPPPLVCNLTAGWLVCLGCLAVREVAAELGALSDGDDGRCDLCDQTTGTFFPATVTMGPVQVAWSMCAACVERWRQ